MENLYELSVNVFQFDIQWLKPQKNISIIHNHIISLDEKPDLVVLPEMFLTGFCMNPVLSGIREDGIEVNELIEISKSNDVSIIGSLAIEEDGRFYNRVLLISPNGIIGRYDKQFLYSPSGENVAFSIKYSTQLIEFKGWKLLPQVCYDLRFPENVRPLPPPDVIIYMANWPAARINHWDVMLKARAIENQCYTIGCNRIGKDENDWIYPGHSILLRFDGAILFEVKESEFMRISLSKPEMTSYREKYKFLNDKKIK
ncbi:MAG: hypothetical protein P1U56_00485 [Saprospiraceae bacterium]|nr:hypothetical protein [Saprospiraceae bacterium]